MQFPNGKRVAVLVSVLLETWADGKSPTYFPRTTPLKAGTPDLPGHEWSQYGAEEGVYRIVSILNRVDVRGTVFANGLSAESYPDLVRAVVKSGHRVQGHGWAQNEYLLDFGDDEQQKVIRRSLEAIERACGVRPDGWVTPIYGANAITHELLVREGLKWHGDALHTSLPRIEQTPSGPIVALPWSDFVDNRVLRASPRDYYDAYAETLDYLSGHERVGLVNIAIHGHFGGRPVMSAVFARLLSDIAKRNDVWLATYGEIVEWFSGLGVEAIPVSERFA